MAAIHKALDECRAEHPIFYEDKVDIYLNAKIGVGWQLRGQQNAWSHWGKMKNTIWPVHYTAAREKSAIAGVS